MAGRMCTPSRAAAEGSLAHGDSRPRWASRRHAWLTTLGASAPAVAACGQLHVCAVHVHATCACKGRARLCPRGARSNRSNHCMHPSGRSSHACRADGGRCRAWRDSGGREGARSRIKWELELEFYTCHARMVGYVEVDRRTHDQCSQSICKTRARAWATGGREGARSRIKWELELEFYTCHARMVGDVEVDRRTHDQCSQSIDCETCGAPRTTDAPM